ncbi:MAG: hypothetical protein ACP5KN_08310 [Armatimonadota bacterium]
MTRPEGDTYTSTMHPDRRKRIDPGIALVVIIAGLLTGGVITWHLLRPDPERRYSPEYPVAESDRIPDESPGGLAEAAEMPPSNQEGTSAEAEPDPGDEADSSDEAGTPGGEEVPIEPPTGIDRDVLKGAQAWNEREGNTEFVELTDKLYVHISARTVILANEIARNPERYPDAQKVMADFLTTQLVKYDVDPDDYYEFTKWVASDHERAKQFGERILREAEEHTKMKIDVSAVPNLSPAPVAPPEEE